MKLHRLAAFTLSLAAFAGLNASAHDYKLGAIAIGHPWARSTSAGQATGGGYLKLDNQGAADRLLSASATVSEKVELHSMAMDGDVMRMRQVDGIDLPTGKPVELKPGGFHIMFVGLKAPLKDGDSFPLVLRFEKAGEVKVDVKIEAANASHDMGAMKH
ncbi:MAG: copper chaperone PCu(A)C [Rhizobacter sp.]|nr:copper chaperone PCu(A)C [Rhizobacter sp.]